jgi:NAD(P)-dependent dehydrogenase (short-subunit alcohol dehydrogenase family)
LEDSISLQLNAVSWVNKLVADSMIEKKNGSIIQLASIYGFVGQDLNLYKNLKVRENMSYSIIKGGLINLTRQMASYYGQYNIRVNSISPGAIKSNNSKDLTNNSVFKSRYLKKTPIKRLGKPSDISSSVFFLSSDASSYITGINLVIDGGFTIT